MSWTRIVVWVCDDCQTEVTTYGSEYDLTPEGWVHTMHGEALCGPCYDRRK